ncbi:hypothetical protein OQ496_07240 [Acetobacter suratthaniensis]|uniref:Uncharacterized protein n=1 Tax=Acetobacter suratthaniensis TaxID=1502841 RepID=A0ABS3LKN5_9PROT|nr:hypothetical protein [Acetobacter suratthaniensis]MBO1328127.1 hypothetical protein [Acetobacter suratthaniensis]MCX2566247.1 hypothetical protein [Acetobacter suratthaniensis]
MNSIYPSVIISLSSAFIFLVFCFINGNIWGKLFSSETFLGRFFFSPALGLGVISTFFFPWSWLFGFGALQSWTGLLAVSAISKGISRKFFSGLSLPSKEWSETVPALFWTIISACVISFLMCSVDIIKFRDHGEFFQLAAPITDHVKINIVQSFINEGFPLQNPFSGAGGERSNFSYYFLWYMVAAVVSCLFGNLSLPWDGDIALTFITSLVSLFVIMGLSISLCRDRTEGLSAARWSVLLSLGGPIVQIVSMVVSPPTMLRLFGRGHGLETWVFQAAWVPQHVLSGTIVVLALLLQQELLKKKTLLLQGMTIFLVANLIAAGFGMSAWVGAVSFLLCAAAITFWQIASAEDRPSAFRIIFLWLVTALASAIMSLPYVVSQLGAAAGHTHPIGIRPWQVLAFVSSGNVLNYIAYWIIFLPLQVGCIYIPFILSIRSQLRTKILISAPCILISLASLTASWHFESKIANNDLGWRAVIPALITMTALSAACIARGIFNDFSKKSSVTYQKMVFISGIMLIAISLPSGLWSLKRNYLGDSILQKKLVEDAYWLALRDTTPVSGRVLTFPDLYRSAESWPVNIGGGLLTQRKSCYLSREYIRAFSGGVSQNSSDEANNIINKFYNGSATTEDVIFLLKKLHCTTIGITENEKIWKLISSGNYKVPFYNVVHSEKKWMILSSYAN